VDASRSPGLWFYSLREVDTDGSALDHGTLAVLVKDVQKGITCMPNPVREGHLLITSTEDILPGAVQIHGMDMRSHHLADVIMEDEEMLMIKIADLQPGVYVASVTLDISGRATCTFVVDQ
jgi:hypothetical protein